MKINRILVPTDFGPAAEAALEAAIELARKLGATVVLMHAYGIPSYRYAGPPPAAAADYLGALEHAAREALSRAAAAHAHADVPIAPALYSGDPAEQILLAVRQHEIGMVVMGTHGHSRLHAILGTVAEKIVRQSPVPVLTWRPGFEAASAKDRSSTT
jgi:nucleotide-binding universal stress UspA family protein